jgi:6-pyruvoyltetrahydropterin/6-carboxytetrahydropterin synthase
MKAYISRRYRFSAAHRLHADLLSEEQNRLTFGKCNNPFGHGHNYTVEVCFSGPVDPLTGMVTNLADLDAFAREHLIDPFDQTNLNTLPLFATSVPSTENLAIALYRILAAYPYAKLERIHVEETPNNSFDYAGGPEAAGRTLNQKGTPA